MSAPGAEVRRHSSEIGWWEMVSRRPAPRLGRHVLGYCGYREETAAFTRRRELPSGEVILIIGFGPALRTTYPDLAPDRVASAQSFVAGLHDTHCMVETPGTQAGIQVNLTPIAAHLLLGVPMRELTNRVVELDDLLGAESPLLVERLQDAPDWEARFELLDEALVRRLDEARSASPDVAWAWRRIVERRGRMAVAELCDELGCSRKHLARRFAEQIGVPPKAYARVLRFQRAVHMLGHRDGENWIDMREYGAAERMGWGEIAVECGYFDHAHMNRDFRDLAGLTPGELAARLLPDGGGLAS